MQEYIFLISQFLKKIKNIYCSLENDILENEIDKKKVKGYFVKSFFRYWNLPKLLKRIKINSKISKKISYFFR